MPYLDINLFGAFRVRRGGNPVKSEEWDRQKTRSLLKLLLTRPGRTFSREEIIEALWPDAPPRSAERSLWVTVSLLRRALEPELERGSDSRYVIQRRPGYLFDGRADCRVDAWEFDEHSKKAEAAEEAGELDKAIDEYRSALELVRGEFLAEEPYEDWAMEVREEWRSRRLAALSGLAECLAQKGRYTKAIEVCSGALALDRYSEELCRRLMLYRYCAGEQALALKAYRDHARLLKKELGVDPPPELTRLKERMEARDVPGVDEGRRRYPRPRRPLRFPYTLSRTHFVGRDGEYALLAERLRETTEGKGGAVALDGEAGVGKTRLAEEFLGYARSQRASVLSGRCYERELGAPLEPILDAMEPLVGASGELTDIPASPIRPQEAPAPEGIQIYRALARELVRKSRSGDHEALVFFIDDVQWADTATLEFLSYFSRRLLDERVLLILAYRREDAPKLWGWLSRFAERRAMTTVKLDRLSREALGQLLTRMSSRGFGGLAEMTGFLHRESEGNPFYAVEYLRWLMEAGIVRTDSRRRISALEVEALEEVGLPTDIASLIEVRLDSVGDEARNLLELAAVVGRTFDLWLLSRAVARGEAEVFASIMPAMASGLVVEARNEAYYFSHDKLRQTLYEGIDGRRRREMHLKVAEALEEKRGDPAELAHHYLRAGEWRPALENLVLAARRAEEAYAWETALRSYARALKVLEKLPDSEERRFELFASRERLLEHMDRHHERAGVVREMFELANRLGDLTRLAEVQIRRVGALSALGDVEGVAEAGKDAVAIFQELGDKAGEARAYREIGYVRWVSRDYAGALEASFKELGIHRELGDRAGEAGAVGNIAQVYRSMENHDEALRWAEEAARLHHELRDKLGEGMRLATVAAIYRERGDLRTALSLSLKTLRYHDEAGAKNLNVAQHNTCGTLMLALGDSEEALKHFRSAVRLASEIGYARDEGNSLMSMGIALERLGDPYSAAEAYRKAVQLLSIAYAESGVEDDLSAKAGASGLLATVLHRSLDRPTEALKAYETALGIQRTLGGVEHLRKLLLGVGGLLWRMGDLEGSANRYEEVLDLAREHGDASHEASALVSLSVVYRDLGRLRESLHCGRRAVELLQGVEDPQAEAYVLSSLAESYDRLGYHKSAISRLKRSLRLRRQMGDRRGEVGVLRALATVYRRLGDEDHAQAALREVAGKDETSEKTSQVHYVERRS